MNESEHTSYDITPQINVDALVEQLSSSQYYELENGFPVYTADQLLLVLQKLQKKQVSRMPIIGMEDGRVFLLATAQSGQKNEHAQLIANLSELGYSEENVAFTTSIENLSQTLPVNLHITLHTSKGDRYVVIGKGSDKLKAQLTNSGQVLNWLFGSIENVSLN